jgi:2-dehydropantoate 2-reductase
MKILVYGAGVLGSLYAARLAESGQEVSILARGQRLRDLWEHGIVLEDARTDIRSVTRSGVCVKMELAPSDRFDLVLVLVRNNQLPSILPALAASKCTPNVLFMTNNATGPDQLVEALGRGRVLLGFPGAGGTRQGHVVRYAMIGRPLQHTTIGELDGRVTPRLRWIARTLRGAGFSVAVSRNMDAWLKTHVAVVSPLANAIYMAGGDNYNLARDSRALSLYVQAVREGLRVLRALKIPITPARYRALEWLPTRILVEALRRGLDTPRAELVIASHANAARDEMSQLASEFRALARATSVPTPAIDKLCSYIAKTPATGPTGDVPPSPERSAHLSVAGAGYRKEIATEYYLARRPALLKEFDREARRAEKVLAAHFDHDSALVSALVKETRREYKILIPQLPYIGGKRNRLTWNLQGAALFLAMYRVLKRHGKSTQEVGQLCYEIIEEQYRRYPGWLLHLLGRNQFTRFRLSRLKRAAEESQKRRYPGDFVYSVIEGDGKEFDFGVDYTECGICKFYHSQGADEFTPFLCPMDYATSRAMGLGMVRTTMLSQGAERCDFRFKRGRPTSYGWPGCQNAISPSR